MSVPKQQQQQPQQQYQHHPLGPRKASLYGSLSEIFADDNVQHIVLQDLDTGLHANGLIKISSSSAKWRFTSLPVLAVAFCAALATGGPTYAFGLYSKTLKDKLHLTQRSLNTISSANFCAGVISFLPGLAIDKFGIRTAMSVGGICMCAAFVLYWFIASLVLPIPSNLIVFVLCTLGVMIFVSNSLIIGSLFKGIVISTGRGSRGSAVGAGKGYVGIGAGVYAILFKSIPTHSDLDFMLLAAAFALFAIAIPARLFLPGLDVTQNHLLVDVTTPRHFQCIYGGLACLIGLVLWSSLAFMFRSQAANISEEDAPQTTHYVKGILILVAWLAPIMYLFILPWKNDTQQDEDDEQQQQQQQKEGNDETQPLKLDEQMQYHSADDMHKLLNDDDDNNENTIPIHTIHCNDRNLSQMLQTVPCWLFLWIATILVGSGTMLTNNMAQMVESRGFSPSASAHCLALFSVAQAMARIGVGEVSERALVWNTQRFGIDYGIPRTIFVIVASVLAVIGHCVLAIATTRPVFVFGIILTGAAFGSIWPLMVLIVADLFGSTSHGSNYMFYDGFTSAFGTLAISKYIVQEVYEAHVDPSIDPTTCYGIDCFHDSQIIVTILCTSCVVFSILLMHMTRDSYGTPIAYHF